MFVLTYKSLASCGFIVTVYSTSGVRTRIDVPGSGTLRITAKGTR